MTTNLQIKARRLLQPGQKPRVLDLFSGCGGISLGFQSAGFSIVANIEIDSDAAASHAYNFHENQADFAVARDITKVSPQQLASELHLGPVEKAIDVVVGGPPCQAYARIGRSKLRKIQQHPEAFLHDYRANLFETYLVYVAAFKPIALLMENVPDIMNQGGQNVAQNMAEALEESGYTTGYTLLNAAYYGVPQMRERMFLIAYRRELGLQVSFPAPTHWMDLPSGYESARKVALKHVNVGRVGLFESTVRVDPHYVVPPPANPALTPAITAFEALADLPVITDHLEGHMRRGVRRFDNAPLLSYRTNHEPTPYGQLMRTWEGLKIPGGIRDHAIRSLPRDYEIFKRMEPGDQYPEALEHAKELFQEQVMRRRAQGETLVDGSAGWEALQARTVPPYDPFKFPNKWRKMEGDSPARTLMAHLGKDSYSHIHYDSAQARTISVREAARLQSFPDGFIFRGTMNPAFRQIGNAVPPLLVKPVAETMLAALRVGIVQYGRQEQVLEPQIV